MTLRIGDKLGVQIIGGRDIVVSDPDIGLSITYRKDGFAPALLKFDLRGGRGAISVLPFLGSTICFGMSRQTSFEQALPSRLRKPLEPFFSGES